MCPTRVPSPPPGAFCASTLLPHVAVEFCLCSTALRAAAHCSRRPQLNRWKKGLKTGMYYLRTRAAADAIKFTVDQQSLSAKNKRDAMDVAPTKPAEPGECLSCGA